MSVAISMQEIIQEIPWLAVIIILPLAAAVVCFLFPQRVRSLGLAAALAITVCVLLLGLQIITQGVMQYAVGGWGVPLGINLYADGLSLLMLIVTALVGLAVSVYSLAYFSHDKAVHFWPIWMLLWTALNALFLSADIFNLYVTLELLGLAAVALVALAGGANALVGAMRYLLVSLLGSLCYLLGVVLLYHSFATLDIALLAERVKESIEASSAAGAADGSAVAPAVWAAMALMSAGLLLKTALFPLHFWLPPAHASAPAPVSALLSALVVKASFYILLRLWLQVFPLPDASPGHFLGILGAAAVIWGGVQALRQTRLKMLIAYSTVAQLGYLFIAFSIASSVAWKGMLYLLMSHALAKSAMFMAAGNLLRFGGHDQITRLDRVAQRLPLTLTAFALAGVSVMGLPPSGGFIGKWLLLDATLRAGEWWWAVIFIVGGLLTAGYIFKVIGHAFTQAEVTHEASEVPRVMEWSALALASAAILLGLIAPWPLALMDIGSPFEIIPVEVVPGAAINSAGVR